MTRVSFGLPVPIAAVLLIPVTAARFQKKDVPAAVLAGVYVNGVLLQIADGVNVLVNTGDGFTVTTTL